MSQQIETLQVLGLSRAADSNAVARAYRRLSVEARGNGAEKARIESAHSTIMMAQLSARMKACCLCPASLKPVHNVCRGLQL